MWFVLSGRWRQDGATRDLGSCGLLIASFRIRQVRRSVIARNSSGKLGHSPTCNDRARSSASRILPNLDRPRASLAQTVGDHDSTGRPRRRTGVFHMTDPPTQRKIRNGCAAGSRNSTPLDPRYLHSGLHHGSTMAICSTTLSLPRPFVAHGAVLASAVP